MNIRKPNHQTWAVSAINLAKTTDLSWRQIANVLGVPKSTCSDYLRKTVG